MDVALEAVTVDFAGVRALDGVTASFPLGSRAVLIGRAGSGKTTFLKVLAGLVPASAGVVRWNAAHVESLSETERRAQQIDIGMVFQSDALFDSLTALENVELPLEKRKVPREEMHRRAMHALEQVGLAHAAASVPAHLSGGMKKRLGVARAIVAEPTVLFADDPLAGLDPETAESVCEVLLRVSKGKTLITALPDPIDALPHDRLIVLRDGAVEFDQKVTA